MKNFITQEKPYGFYGMKATTLMRWCFGLTFLLTGLSIYGQTFPLGASTTINASGSATPYPNTFSISGVVGNISDISVTLTGLSHTWPNDIDILLVSPTGAMSTIMCDRIGGNGGIVDRNYTFVIGGTAIATSGFPASGTYGVAGTAFGGAAPAPAGPYTADLNNFVGTDPNGVWSLYIHDDTGGDSGSLIEWSITVTGTSTEEMDYNNIQWLTDGSTGSNTSYTALAGTTLTAYAQGYEVGVTEAAGAGAGVEAWIGYSSTNDDPANAGWTWTAATFNTQDGNNDEFQANLPALSAGTYYVASRWRLSDGPFTYGGHNGSWNGVDSNNIELILTPNPTQCATPLLPADAATDVAYPVANISWTAPTSGPAPTGYQVWFGTNPDALTNLGTVTLTNVNITGLLSNTTYHWRIIPTSTVGGDATDCVIRSFTTQPSPFAPYCDVPAFTSAVEPITLVNFAGINSTFPNTVLTPAAGGVSHVDNIAVSGDVTAGQTYEMTLQGNTDGNFTNNFRVFIDWNQDGDFADEGETFNAGSIINSTGLDAIQAVSSIAVPMTAMGGSTRMRVKKIFSTTNLDNPCLSAGFGQVIDYTLNVQLPVTQITQLFLEQCGLTVPASNSTVVLNAYPVEDATNYEFEVTINNGMPETINTANSYFTFGQLSALPSTSATVSVKVRATVDGIVGEWGNTCEVKTVTQITQLFFEQCGLTVPANNPTVVLNAYPVENATSYDFMVTVNGGEVQMINTPISYISFSQLSALPDTGSTIAVAVRATVNGIVGEWGNTCEVITSAPTQITQLFFEQCSLTVPANNPTVVLNAYPVENATSYDFMVTVNGGEVQMINTPISYISFSQLSALPDTGSTIAVAVRATVNGVVGEWGNTCTVSTPASTDEEMIENITSNQDIVAYPNPFSNQFTLKLANNTEATIQIFDINGRLISNQLVSGSYEVELGQNLTSGVYLVRVEQNNESTSLKMIKK